MKTKIKLAIIAAGIIALPFTTNAQKGNLQVGAHAGVNISKLCCGSMTINEDYTFGEGPAFGLTGSYGLNKYLSLAAELNYTTMGGKKNGMQTITPGSTGLLYADFKNKTVLNYLELPVMARVTLGTGNFKYYANIGIFGAYLLSAKQVKEGTSSIYTNEAGTTELANGGKHSFDKDLDISAQVKDLNFGLVGGLGAGYTFGKHGIWLDGRYVLGMPNIRENTAVNGENSTGSIMATVGYTYTLNSGK